MSDIRRRSRRRPIHERRIRRRCPHYRFDEDSLFDFEFVSPNRAYRFSNVSIVRPTQLDIVRLVWPPTWSTVISKKIYTRLYIFESIDFVIDFLDFIKKF